MSYDSILQLGLVLGLFLSIIITFVLEPSSRLFTKDADVLHLIRVGIPVTNSLTSPSKEIPTLSFLPLHCYIYLRWFWGWD